MFQLIKRPTRAKWIWKMVFHDIQGGRSFFWPHRRFWICVMFSICPGVFVPLQVFFCVPNVITEHHIWIGIMDFLRQQQQQQHQEHVKKWFLLFMNHPSHGWYSMSNQQLQILNQFWQHFPTDLLTLMSCETMMIDRAILNMFSNISSYMLVFKNVGGHTWQISVLFEALWNLLCEFSMLQAFLPLLGTGIEHHRAMFFSTLMLSLMSSQWRNVIGMVLKTRFVSRELAACIIKRSGSTGLGSLQM